MDECKPLIVGHLNDVFDELVPAEAAAKAAGAGEKKSAGGDVSDLLAAVGHGRYCSPTRNILFPSL